MRHIPFVLLFVAASLAAQTSVQPDPPSREWHASWITHPTAPLREPIVLHFRRTLDLSAAPATYTVRVSADNRFILYVNGQRVGDGPARGDLTHWRYEKFDLAPYLKAGSNLITATVWNFGVYNAVAQMSDRTAFLLESEATDATEISTPKDWQVEVEPGHKPLPRVPEGFWAYMAQGPGEQIDAADYDWNWQSPGDKNSAWVPAASPVRESVYPTVNKAHSADETGDNPWGLVPDLLPHMDYSGTKPGTVVCIERSDNTEPKPQRECQQRESDVGHFVPMSTWFKLPPRIPANSHVHLILDRDTLTTAYPQLTVSGGKGSTIRFTYSEALYDDKQQKGDRDSITYKDANGVEHPRVALGLHDLFHPDGGQHRTFEPLWWRTWRYIDLDITTLDQPLTLESLKANFTAYPFEERAKLDTPDPDLAKIWDISWRTARLDAHETYMDTPYYEQLQYIGDTRIQALISYSVAGDDRLARQALEAFNDSRIPEGITRSRYPSSLPQNIPTFSLLWIGMLHDWYMYRPDPTPVRESLDGTRSVLNWYAQYEQPDGLLKKTPWWSFIDWIIKGELSSYSANGESCLTTLEYLGALDQAADLEQAFGDPHIAGQHRERAAHVRSGLTSQCWDPGRKLMADNPDRTAFSEQANILGVLYDAIPKDQQADVLRRMLPIQPGTTPDEMQSASLYFRFYLARALDHAGIADQYLGSLDAWRTLLPLHFSTWPEQPGETRSDSHAWTAHPIYDLLTLVAGIEPASPGFKTVRIAPHLGDLKSLSASFPDPLGMITVKYQRQGEVLDATITLRGHYTGTFVYHGKSQPLHPGDNHIVAK
jgi:alpha-L-rhamnosidase